MDQIDRTTRLRVIAVRDAVRSHSASRMTVLLVENMHRQPLIIAALLSGAHRRAAEPTHEKPAFWPDILTSRQTPLTCLQSNASTVGLNCVICGPPSTHRWPVGCNGVIPVRYVGLVRSGSGNGLCPPRLRTNSRPAHFKREVWAHAATCGTDNYGSRGENDALR